MNWLHVAEAGLGLIAAWEGGHYLAPRAWRWVTARKPKLLDEARTVLHDAEAAVVNVVHHVEVFDPRTAAVEAAPVVAEVVAEAAPVVTELAAEEQDLVAKVQTYLAGKDSLIADVVAKADRLKAQRAAVAAQLHGLLG